MPRLIPIVPVALSFTGLASGQVLTFSDQTASSQIDARYQTQSGGISFPQFMVAGGAAGDFDRDGDPDVFILSGGHAPDRLYINNGDGTFTDRAAAWGVDATHIGGGASVADYDNDGDLDLYVTSFGPANGFLENDRHFLYRNNGDNTFTDVALEAGVRMASPTDPDGFSSTWGDYDMDGDLDLFVGGWMDENHGDRLFRNDGPNAEGVVTFTDVTDQLTNLGTIPVFGFSPTFQDTNADGYPELLIAADFSTSQYLRNDAGQGFANITTASGTGLDENGMGATTGDFNNDGLVDWYVTAIWSAGGNKLYMNQGEHVFEEVSVAAGVNQGGWGWGAAAVDIDNDADLDIIETNGWNLIDDPSFVFLNNLDGTFTEAGVASGMNHVTQGRSIVLMDHDLDGDVDVLFLSHIDPAYLFRNELTKDAGASWLRVRLDNCGASGLTPDGVGAHLELSAGGVTQHRWITAAPSYVGQGEMIAHFGLDTATTIDELRVTWPNGYQRVLTDLGANQHMVVTANRADISPPWGTLDISDVIAFLEAWIHQRPDADLAAPTGALDYADILAFLGAFGAGCRE
ncbi:MAG: FG-GAP-like repeat-containing protein [Phycisphaerales bacterium JB059]